MKEIAKKALFTLKQDFGEDIFVTPKFRGAIMDVPINVNAKKIRFLLILAICEMNVYKRLQEANFETLVNEMAQEYSIDKNAAEAIISAIAEVLGKKILSASIKNEHKEEQEEQHQPNEPVEIKEGKGTECIGKKFDARKGGFVKHKTTEIITKDKAIKQVPKEFPRIHNIIEFGDFKWRVLKLNEQDGSLLLISAYIIGKMAYHNRRMPITWEESDLRQYLNENFYKKFDKKDKDRIIEIKTRTSFNEQYLTAGGATCTDNIFVLSTKEAESLFRNNLDRITKYKNDPDWWWLRSPGKTSQAATFINSGGAINYEGEESVYTYTSSSMKHIGYRIGGVRPAMYVKL
ncbi:MAG: DUF6273 domain-containing protein [Defluviitaleaceae bacterium]|nr:DUF6273 domain-containing protein [Defluviitaleaceae bacterium]